LLPTLDGFLIALQRLTRRSLATPAELPQDLPHVSRVITHPAFLLDHMDYPVRSPQAGFIPQRLRPAFEAVLDLADLLRTQSRFAAGAASLLQPGTPFGFQLGCPLTHRLPMRTHPARHFRLAQPFRKQTRRPHAPSLQCREVSAYPCWKSHSSNLTQNASIVTILGGTQIVPRMAQNEKILSLDFKRSPRNNK